MEQNISKEQFENIENQMAVLYEYMKLTEDVIKPIDKIACQAIDNIISMTMVSLGRKYGLDYCEESKDEQKEQSIDNIMKEINEGTENK